MQGTFLLLTLLLYLLKLSYHYCCCFFQCFDIIGLAPRRASGRKKRVLFVSRFFFSRKWREKRVAGLPRFMWKMRVKTGWWWQQWCVLLLLLQHFIAHGMETV